MKLPTTRYEYVRLGADILMGICAVVFIVLTVIYYVE